MAKESFFSDRNYDGTITISDIWISFQELAISVGWYVKAFLNLFTNNSIGRFFEVDIFYWEPNTYLYVGIGIIIVVLFSIVIWILDSFESYRFNLEIKQLRKEEKERDDKRMQEILKAQEEKQKKRIYKNNDKRLKIHFCN
jgi:hypothetical protein